MNEGRSPDQNVERQLLRGRAVGHKVQRRIDVRARVHAQAQARDVIVVAPVHIADAFEQHRRVVGPDRHVRADRHRDVNDARH